MASPHSILNLMHLISLSLLIGQTNSQNNTAIDGIPTMTRIVGGNMMYKRVPSQISFQVMFQNQWRHFCSGSIISPDFFLTAAHCVNGEDVTQFSVLAGVTDLKSKYGSRHYVQGYQTHEGYVPVTKCDIAIVKVMPPFELNGVTIDAIDFTDTSTVEGGVPVTLTGWGSMQQDGRGSFPDNLQMLDTKTIYNFVCTKFFSRLQDTEICTFRRHMMGACNGDSGGPLMSSDGTKLVGIVAFGTRKCANGKPDFYTRVSKFVQWILAKMALH